MQLLLEKLDIDEIRKFAGMFGRINKLLADKDLPEIKRALDSARTALADIARGGDIQSSPKKIKVMSDLVLFQSMMIQLFRMIPSIMQLVGPQNEIVRRLNNLMLLEKDEAPSGPLKDKYSTKTLAAELDIEKEELVDVMGQLGIRNPGAISSLTAAQAQQIFTALTSAEVKDPEPGQEMEPIEKAAIGAQKNPQLGQEIKQAAAEEQQAGGEGEAGGVQKVVDALGGEASDQVSRLEAMIKSSTKQRGFLKGLFLGRMPFGLDQQAIVNDFLDMPYDQFQKLANQVKGEDMQVGISSDDAKELAASVKKGGLAKSGGDTPGRMNKDQLQKFLTSKFPKANADGLKQLIDAIPTGTTIE